jgi:hypothetical protein
MLPAAAKVRFAFEAAPPVSDINKTLRNPPGLTSSTCRSATRGCVTPFNVTETPVVNPVTPDTVTSDGYVAAFIAAQQSVTLTADETVGDPPPPELVIARSKPVNDPESTSQSSSTNNDQVPFGGDVFNAAIVDPYAPTGAGAGNTSAAGIPGQSSTPFVGLYGPAPNTVFGTPVDPASLNVTFTPDADTPESDNNTTLCAANPSGGPNKTSKSPDAPCVKPFSVTVTFVIVPVAADTTDNGYGEADCTAQQSVNATEAPFENVAADAEVAKTQANDPTIASNQDPRRNILDDGRTNPGACL